MCLITNLLKKRSCIIKPNLDGTKTRERFSFVAQLEV